MGKFKMPSINDIDKETVEQEAGKGSLKVGAGLLSEASKAVKRKANDVYIPRNKIVKNPKNQYSIKGIPSLAESIKNFDLIEPLHIAPEKDGYYMLLGGERRLSAIDLLIEDPEVEDWTEDTLIWCVIKGSEDVKLNLSPENKERYAIMITNKESRKYTDGDVYRELQDWKEIIAELRENGEEYLEKLDDDGNEVKIQIKGENTRDILSQTVGISRGQVNKFETVHNKGSDKLKNALLDGKISVSVAEKAIKTLTPEQQDEVIEQAESGEVITTQNVTKFKTETKEVITQQRFRKDIKSITSKLKEQEILLDENALEKYHFHIKQIENLLGGH